jgi:hypothetical protein
MQNLAGICLDHKEPDIDQLTALMEFFKRKW